MTTPENVKRWILQGLPESQVSVIGDGHHFEAQVISGAFADQNEVQRHRLVYAALGEHMHTDIHALSIKAMTPDEFESLSTDAR